MKKFISILLALILALCPIAALGAGAPSPSVGPTMLFKSEPKVTFMIPAPDESWITLAMDQYLSEDYKWTLMDVIILKTEEAYPEFLCKFSIDPTEKQEVGIVLTDLEYKFVYAEMGEKMENNWIKFNFSDVEPDTYVMFVYISKVD